jgi:hypothetical protein
MIKNELAPTNPVFGVGTEVDLFDNTFRSWRGAYKVIGHSAELVRIENLKTKSKQRVNPKRLRRARLSPFALRI